MKKTPHARKSGTAGFRHGVFFINFYKKEEKLFTLFEARLPFCKTVSLELQEKAMKQNTQALLFVNGTIRTLRAGCPQETVQALLVRQGEIAAAGSEDALRTLAGAGVKTVDLQGGTLLPGFVDGHSHLSKVAAGMLQLSLAQIHSPARLVEIIRETIEKNNLQPGDWVQGYGYDQNTFPEQMHPTTDLLDKAAPDNPVFISHVSGHAGVMNTAALRALGQTGDDGYREESAYFELMHQLPMPTEEEFAKALYKAQKLYASYGITTVQEGMMTEQMLPLYRQWVSQDAFFLDVVGYAEHTAAARFEEAFSDCLDTYNKHFKLGGVKMFLDGSPQNRTAWMRQPYLPQPGALGEWCGEPTQAQAETQRIVNETLGRNRQLLTHVNGDAAVQSLLQALQTAQKNGLPVKKNRPVLIHAQLIGRDQLQQVKELGAWISFFVAHVWEWGDTHIQNFGLEKASLISPAGSALRLGIPFTFHQDAPVLVPDMLHTLRCAVQRRTRQGVQLSEEEALTPQQALEAVTLAAAAQYFEETEKGSLEAGKRADLTWLSADPLKVQPAELDDIVVRQTWKDGVPVWSAEKEERPELE